MVITLISWWLAIQFIGIVTLPLTTLLFKEFPLNGYIFSKTLGLITVSYTVWLLASFRLILFGLQGIFFTGLIIFIIGWWGLSHSEKLTLIAIIRNQWRKILIVEFLFAITFLCGLWLRWNGATGAAIVGTEKPMELAFLSGILQSTNFPPQDPWLAGYAINYYYLGYVIIATLAVLSNTTVGETFNLGLATIFALTTLMISGIVFALIQQTKEKVTTKLSAIAVSIVIFTGIMFVLVFGNQAGALQLVTGKPEIVALNGSELASVALQFLQGSEPIEVVPPVRTHENDFGIINELNPSVMENFNWWWPSRAIWDEFELSPDVVERRYTITEFPFFSFYLGDLHPHVLALPFGLLTLALSFALFIRPTAISGANRQERLTLIVTAMILGSLYMINSWDAPTYTLLYVGALALAYKRQATEQNCSQILWRTLQTLIIVGGLTVVVLIPFLLTFKSFAGGGSLPTFWDNLPVVSTFGKIFLPVPDHTGLHEFINIFGVFVIILFVYAFSIWFNNRNENGDLFWQSGVKIGWGITGCTLVVGFLFDRPLLALLPMVIVLWWIAWHRTNYPAQAFVLWGMAVGAIIIFIADIVYLRDPFENRMNTIFKFYYQAWIIWGTIAAFGVWELWQMSRQKLLFRVAWLIPVILLSIGALVYPVATLRWGQPWITEKYTLNGLDYWQNSSPDEAAAIEWIKYNTQPSDVVLTSVGSSYDGSTGWVAAVTGRPTLLGWSGSHQRLWRRGSPEVMTEIEKRERDIPTIYTTSDVAIAQHLLKQYDIQYLFIGPTELRLYSGLGLDKFSSFLELVFEQGNVRIYRCF